MVMHSPPVAYFITFRCYGTWLHGDPRGSVDRSMARDRGDAVIETSLARMAADEGEMVQEAVVLSVRARSVIERTIHEVCAHRGWNALAVNARTNHVHVVVAGSNREPEFVMTSFKAWCTRRMAEAGLCARGARVWSRHGSTVYLWDPEKVREKVMYVVDGQ